MLTNGSSHSLGANGGSVAVLPEEGTEVPGNSWLFSVSPFQKYGVHVLRGHGQVAQSV